MTKVSDKYIIEQQFIYLAKLQELQPIRPVRVQRPQGGDFNLEGKYWNDQHEVWTSQPLLTCSVLNNELAFDPDLKDWQLLKKEIDRLIKYMDSVKIPYLLAWSGGNGLHIEVFFTKNIQIPDEIAEGIEKYQIDIGIIVRTFLVKYILNKSEIDSELIKLDWSKIKWSNTSKGSMIRILGCTRPDGGIKTLITTIPDERPIPGTLPLIFPNYLEQWDISFLQREIIEAIKEEISKNTPPEEDLSVSWLTKAVDKAREEGRIKYTPGKNKNCQGLKAALKGGIGEGHRDAVATGLAIALKFWKNESKEKILKSISNWCIKGCQPPLDFKGRGIDTKIINICRKTKIPERSTPCTFFIQAGLCSGSRCSVMRKKGYQ